MLIIYLAKPLLYVLECINNIRHNMPATSHNLESPCFVFHTIIHLLFTCLAKLFDNPCLVAAPFLVPVHQFPSNLLTNNSHLQFTFQRNLQVNVMCIYTMTYVGMIK